MIYGNVELILFYICFICEQEFFVKTREKTLTEHRIALTEREEEKTPIDSRENKSDASVLENNELDEVVLKRATVSVTVLLVKAARGGLHFARPRVRYLLI